MRKSLLIVLSAATALAAGSAYAQAESRSQPRADMTRAVVEQRTSEMFGRMDTNADGVLNDADREASRKQAFDRIDTDKDGTISFTEFEARRGDRGEAREARGGARGHEFAERGSRPFGGRGMARQADADKDGTVTQAEFTTAALARFDQADADKDGTISLEERREARQHMRHEMRRGRPARDAG
ncbi:MAG TPA: EF-hand domain-containing protein [Croceibacterium sp.]|nr:EF-hand domain-containing protein [Croceibacterium sp.]